MIRKRYYSPFETDEIVEPQRVTAPQAPTYQKHDPKPRKMKCASLPNKPRSEVPSPLGFLAGLKLDDLIIIGLLLLLLFEEQEKLDMPLIVGLAILLLIEFIDNDSYEKPLCS